MATLMNVSLNYGTNLPALIKAMEKTKGDVLELGMGVFSTPFLHYQCILQNRKLVSYENYQEWLNFFLKYHYECPNHEIHFVDKYSNAPIDKPWDVVLVDQTPDESRLEEVKRLANLVQYIVLHDTSPRQEGHYHFSTIYPLFKYKTDWDKDDNHCTVLSNFHNLEDFWK
jgi:hypothetical protein